SYGAARWMIGFEFERIQEPYEWIMEKVFCIFFTGLSRIYSLIRIHPAIHSSNHPWDGIVLDLK
ncbi:MAG: hypothetical protein WAX69_05775, partial [Victivallales bacterium]